MNYQEAEEEANLLIESWKPYFPDNPRLDIFNEYDGYLITNLKTKIINLLLSKNCKETCKKDME